MCTDGGPGLKATEAYPPNFGHAVAGIFARHRVQLRAQAPDVSKLVFPDVLQMILEKPEDPWGDAGLSHIICFLAARLGLQSWA